MKNDSVTLDVQSNITLIELFKIINEKIFEPKNYTILSKNQGDLVAGILCLVDGVDYRLWMEDHNTVEGIKEITFISSLHGG